MVEEGRHQLVMTLIEVFRTRLAVDLERQEGEVLHEGFQVAAQVVVGELRDGVGRWRGEALRATAQGEDDLRAQAEQLA